VGCFAYSPVEGAAANALPDPVPDAVREERQARFMEVQARISAARLARKVGSTVRVLVDSAQGTRATGRTAADAPEIDGVVHLMPPEKASKTLKVGEFTKARILETRGHDLIAQPI
jgi:ribosomal protein S12 methylthiotransferase